MAKDDIADLEQEANYLFERWDLPLEAGEGWISIQDTDVLDMALTEYIQEEIDKRSTWLDAPIFDEPTLDNNVIQNESPRLQPSQYPGQKRESPYGLIPPPDAIAFYLPFHLFLHSGWGVYFVFEEFVKFVIAVWGRTEGRLDPVTLINLCKKFVYGHEAFHHRIESFVTKLEIVTLERKYLDRYLPYSKKVSGTGDDIEEALANAEGLNYACRTGRASKYEKAVFHRAIVEISKGWGPGYNRMAEFLDVEELKHATRTYLDTISTITPTSRPQTHPNIWGAFPSATRGIADVTTQGIFQVKKGSPILSRIPIDVRLFNVSSVKKKLKGKAGLTYKRPGKGSHEIWITPEGRTVVIPSSKRELSSGTLKSILRQAGINSPISEFFA